MTDTDRGRAGAKTPAAADSAGPRTPDSRQQPKQGPGLGKRLKIRSMVTMAGEVLPFFWPMRNFIHHNPLHGLEDRPFEQAVAEASHLFHARGYLKRVEYQQLMARGSIAPEVLEELVAEFVADWLAEHDGMGDRDLAELLQRCLLVLLTRMSQPAPGDDVPAADAVVAAMGRLE